ncbi:hypothetical protein [Paenisporosarcina sp. NPDC076898]|uniref:hypothetical protein n=1 Tax=unclassified Paenisporosarcina TaxID=2642018 RepID=UPI003D04E37B
MNNYFFCYNKTMARHLNKNGFQHITRAIAPKSNKVFYLFEVTDELNDSINTFSSLVVQKLV